MKPEPPEAPCIWCGKPSNDWMYRCGLVTADKTICGACKIDFGKKLRSLEKMIDEAEGKPGESGE